MASDDSSGPRSAGPIVLRIKLRYDDVEAMVQRFATNVGKSGLFLPTKALQPIGAEIKFELRLADDTPALVGLGRVKLAQAPDPNNPKGAFGMTIELMRVTPQSRALILRMLERRRELGLPELGLPTAADIDAARRADAVHAPARDPASGPVPASTAPSEAAAIPAPAVAAAAAAAPAAVAAAPPAPPPGEALLTSPRRTTGPIAVAKVITVTPLAPEPPRRKRPAVSEVIERASGPVASVSVAVPGLDDDVDLAAVIARARALAGGGLDEELEALCEVAAAPLEISVEAASAELARQFGGSAVLRDRSARWAPPPATAIPAPHEVSRPRAEPPEPASDQAQAQTQAPDPGAKAALDEPPGQARGQDAGPLPEPAHEMARDPARDPALEQAHGAEQEPEQAQQQAQEQDHGQEQEQVREPAPAPELEQAHGPDPEQAVDQAHVARAFSPPGIDQIATEPRPRASRPRMARPSPSMDAGEPASAHATVPEDHEVEPDQIADEIHQLGDLDLEDVEHTEMGAIPVIPGAYDPPGYPGEPSAVDQEQLADRLEAQLAEAEAEAAADDLGIAVASGMPVYSDPETAYDDPAKLEAELRDDEDAEPPHDLSLEEFEDFEILAEADADDADLLTSHGEEEASNSRLIYERAPSAPRQPSEFDFAARLDLDEDGDMYFAVQGNEFAAQHVHDAVHDEFADRHTPDGLQAIFEDEPRFRDPHLDSAGHALAAFETEDDPFGETGDEPLEQTADRSLDDSIEPSTFDPKSLEDSIEPVRLEPKRGVRPIFDDPEPSSSYTLAGIPSDSVDLDLGPQSAPVGPAGAAWPPNNPLAVGHPEPAILRGSPPALTASPVEDFELENALEALDINLDDLSISQAAPQVAPRPSHNRPTGKADPTAVLRQAPRAPSPPVQGRASVPLPAQGRASVPLPAQGRAPVPTPVPTRAQRPTGPVAPVPTRAVRPTGPVAPVPTRAVRPTGRVAPVPARAVRPTGPVAPVPARAVRPTGPVPQPSRAPSPQARPARTLTEDGAVIEFVNDDDDDE